MQAPSIRPTSTPTVRPSPTPKLLAEYQIPTADSDPQGIVAGPDGNLWFTEYYGNKIGKITTSGTITEYPIPTADSQSFGIALGADGNLWFAESGSGNIGRITTTGKITEFPTGWPIWGITAGPDGDLWFTGGSGGIGRITTTGVLTYFQTTPADTFQGGITAGPDGNFWFTQAFSGRCNKHGCYPAYAGIGMINRAGVSAEYPLHDSYSDPNGITAGPDGNLWFTEWNWGVGKITTSGTITEYALPTNGGPGITTGSDGNLWFTEASSSEIGRITTGGVITQFPLPRSSIQPNYVVTGPDGNLWFTENGTEGNRIAKFMP
jgi:streptogramin lyase